MTRLEGLRRRRRRRWVTRLTLVLAVVGAAAVATSLPGEAESDGRIDRLVVSETVEAKLDAAGQVQEARLLTRLEAQGSGRVVVRDPTEPTGFRRLDGFRRPTIEDGIARWELRLNGAPVTRLTDAEYTRPLPVVVRARYELDGEPVVADELAGATGEATIRVQVRNLTTRSETISFTAADGERIEDAVDVAVPLLATVRTRFDHSWSGVESDEARIGIDPEGTAVAWDAALFEPLGATIGELVIRGEVEDAVLPEIVVEALPVTRASSELLAAAYGGLDERLVSEAVLAFSLGELDTGLVELAAGTDELAEGLEELQDATAGLASGIDEAAAGSQELAAGLGGLATGAGELTGGLDELAAGSGELAEGSQQLAAGVGELEALAEALAALEDAPGDIELLVGALEQLAGVARQLEGGAAELTAGLEQFVGALPVPEELPDLSPIVELAGGLEALLESLTEALEEVPGGEAIAAARGLVADVDGRLEEALSELEEVDAPAAEAAIEEARALLAEIDTRLAEVEGALEDQFEEVTDGLEGLTDGLGALVALVEEFDALDPADLEALQELPAGAAALQEGIGQLADALDLLAGQVGALTDAVPDVGPPGVDPAEGIAQLVAGAEGLAEGASGLAQGLGAAAAGSEDLAAGAGGLAEGGQELAEGLTEAGEGAAGIAGGVGGAAEGASGLSEGIEQLADEGIGALLDQSDAALERTRRDLARLRALEDRAGADAMPVGAPPDAVARGRYRLVLAAGAPAERATATWQLVGAFAALVSVAGVEAFARRQRLTAR